MSKSNKRGGLSFVLFIIILVIAYATNPSEEKFREYLHHKINEYAETQQDDLTGGLIKIFSGTAADLIPVEKKDFYIFSVYREKLTEDESTFIGAFNHFFMLPQSEKPERNN